MIHTEIFFDPQTHTDRGIAFDTVINGIYNALLDGEKSFGISSNIIACFLRHLSQESAIETLESILKHQDKITGVGLDSSEAGNPPEVQICLSISETSRIKNSSSRRRRRASTKYY